MGIFTTNADTYANGFYGPQNITYQNPGWGVDPNLMTPSYAAPYRPEYDGSGPYVPSSNPGYFSSLGTLVNPMYQQPLYQTPGQAIQPYVMSAGSRPRDAFMAGMQRYMVPGLAFGAAMKVFGPNTGTVMGDLAGTFTGKGVAGAMGRGFGQGVAGGFMRASGLSGVELNASIQAFNAASKARSVEYAAMRAAQAARTGFGAGAVNAAESMAFNAGTLGQGMRAAYAAGGVRGAAGLAVRGASGAVGAAAANILIPMAIAEGVSATADAAVFDPYVNSRQTSKDLIRNFSGVTFSDAEGIYSRGGKGLGYRESARIANEITKSGMKDFVLSSDEYTAISDMSARSGLLDNTKAQDISKKVKSIADQVKLIISISQDPSIKNAVEELSKLQLAGATLSGGQASQGASAYSQIGMSASAAGTTVRRLMDRVGAQGQLLYQMNGMTPYMGQLAAAGLYAGFASGSRTGLIGEAQLARMGGLEGATQSAMTGSIAALRTPYARMAMYNQFIGGMANNTGRNISDVVGNFGRLVGGNPVDAMGTQLLFGDQMAGTYMRENGLAGLEKNALSFLKAAGQSPGKNGMYSAAQLAMALQAQGMSPDQIQAFMAQRSSETDPDSLKQRLGGYRSQTIEQMKNYLDSEGLVDTWFGRGKHSIAKQWKNFKVYSAERSAFTLNNAVGESTDWFDRAWNDLWWGDTIKQGDSISADSLFGRLGSQYADAGYRKLSSQEAERAKISGLRPGEDVYSANYKGFNLSRIGKDKNSFRNGRKGQAPDDMLSVKDSTGIAKAIEKMADDIDHPGSKLARQFMTETDPSKRKKILSELMRSNPKEFRSGAYNDLFIKGYSSGVSMSDVFLADLQGTQTQDIYRKVDRNGVSDFESSLDRVLGGKSGSSFDELRSIGKMGELSQLFLQGKFDATNVDELINGDPELKKLMGNRRGSQAMAYINDTVKRAMSEGRLLTGTSALRVGSLNDAIKTNGSTIMDKDIRAKFLAAKNRGDTQGMNRALSEYAVKLTGGLDKDLKINVPSDSLAKTGEAARKLLEGGAAASKDMENSMDYGVDYKGTYADIIKKFDQPMDKFGGHIENFGRFVDRLVKSNAGGGGGGVYQNNQKVLSN